MAFVMSPSGAMFPRTPGNVATYEEGKGSNEKPKPKLKKEVEKMMDVERDAVFEENEKLKAEAEGFKNELEMYREKMWNADENLLMVEKMIEDNEMNHRRELGAEQERRRELEERLLKLEADREDPTAEGSLKAREISLREKEFELAKRKYDARKADADEADAPAECSLSVSDPAGNVLYDLSTLRSLEEPLRNERASITTIAGLLDYALLKNPELVEIMESVAKYSMKFVLERFNNKFKSLFKISKASLSIVTILMMGKLNPVKTKAAVKYAASRFKRELLREVHSAAKSGSVPALDASFKLMVLTDLPGIKELLSSDDKDKVESHLRTIEEFVVGVVCHVKDVKRKLEDAMKVLDGYDGKLLDDADHMLAGFNDLFDVCTSWLGSEIEGDFQKVQRFLSKCPESVQDAYADHISAEHDGERINELTMLWSDFESLIQTVWESSMIKKRVRYGFGRSEESVVSNAFTSPPSYAAAADRAPPARAAEPVVDHYKKIDCSTCAKPFSPSMKQFQRFEEQKIPLPYECPKCKGQICDKFRETGVCAYGDACKFLHPEGEATVVSDLTEDGPKKHSYSCRFFATGHCMSGDKCKFQHGPPKAGAVMNISEVDPLVHNISEVDTPKDESLAVEVFNRFKKFEGVDSSQYRYI